MGGGGEGRAGIGGRGGVRGRGRAGGVSASVIDVEIALFGTRGCRRWGGGGRRGGRLGVDVEIALLGTRGIGGGRRGMGGGRPGGPSTCGHKGVRGWISVRDVRTSHQTSVSFTHKGVRDGSALVWWLHQRAAGSESGWIRERLDQ